ETAAATRANILQTALALFKERGYAATGMSDVASGAGVAVQTIYSSVGNKPQLLIALLQDAATDATIAASMSTVGTATESLDVLTAIGHGGRLVLERHDWLLGALYDNAAADPVIATMLRAEVDEFYRRLQTAATQLVALGGIRDGLDTNDVTTILWFHFGFEPWRTLRKADWSWNRAERWLLEQAARGLLRS
ncbi:MAG: TetR/AcrR family transcriptional regulator, partial [Janthinobacterium lividum]